MVPERLQSHNVFFCAVVTLKGGFDHAPIHLHRGLVSLGSPTIAKMAAEWLDLPIRTVMMHTLSSNLSHFFQIIENML